MTPALIVAAIVEVVKLINWNNEHLPPDEAIKRGERLAKVLEFLFGWMDKLHDTPPGTP